MHFDLVDRVLENSPEGITTLKLVSAAEEYLQDHFPGFPVLPGVMMLEAMVQAGRRHLERFGPPGLAGPPARRAVLGRVRALKYGSFVKPGASIRVRLSRLKHDETGVEFKGEVCLVEPSIATDSPQADPPTACSGRILLRPMRAD